MPKKKRPRRRKQQQRRPTRPGGARKAQKKPQAAAIRLAVPSHESNRTFTALLFCPALIASAIALHPGAQHLLRAALLISSLLAAFTLGGLLQKQRTLAPLKAYHSIHELKASLDSGLVHEGHQRLMVNIKGAATAVVLLTLISAFTAFVPLSHAAALLALTCALLAAVRMVRPESPMQVLLICTALLAVMWFEALLGVASQTERIVPAVGVIGFVPACLLAASLVALYAAEFESRRWRRMRQATGRSGKIAQRPGGIAILYSSFLLFGPVSVFVLATAHKLPAPFLAAAVVLITAPNLAIAFQTSSLPNEVVFARTLRQAALMTLVVAVAAAISASR